MKDFMKALLLDNEGNPMENRRVKERRESGFCPAMLDIRKEDRRKALPLIQVDAEVDIDELDLLWLASLPSRAAVAAAESMVELNG